MHAVSWIPSAGKLKVNAESYRQAEAVLKFPGGNVRQPRWYQLRMESGQVGTTRSLETSGIGLALVSSSHQSLGLSFSINQVGITKWTAGLVNETTYPGPGTQQCSHSTASVMCTLLRLCAVSSPTSALRGRRVPVMGPFKRKAFEKCSDDLVLAVIQL